MKMKSTAEAGAINEKQTNLDSTKKETKAFTLKRIEIDWDWKIHTTKTIKFLGYERHSQSADSDVMKLPFFYAGIGIQPNCD